MNEKQINKEVEEIRLKLSELAGRLYHEYTMCQRDQGNDFPDLPKQLGKLMDAEEYLQPEHKPVMLKTNLINYRDRAND